VSLTGREIVSVKPSLEGPHFGTVASWFAMLLNICQNGPREA
jgi:hypothetical protein